MKPLSAFYSTNLNPNVTTHEQLAERIMMSLGYPIINPEVTCDMIMNNIALATTMFTKWAGYKEEFLIFDSDIYKRGVGIRMDVLFSATPDMYQTYTDTTNSIVSGGWDYDLLSYRRVIDVVNFEEGTNKGINTLFTLEQTLAQQTYFSYALGNYGFDLVSWHAMKEWQKLREKMLALRIYTRFDARTQYLKLIPEPVSTVTRYVGLVKCYVERPLKDIVVEMWVYQYALALSKITVGTTRGKYSGTVMMGGGSLNYNDILQQGLTEKDKLETKLYEGSASGFGDASPPLMMIG